MKEKDENRKKVVCGAKIKDRITGRDFINLLIRANEKIPVFRVTRFYLNLLVKSRFFSGFLEKI